jgi:hypothetical protein
MSMIVIMPGGFHPFHAGHYALYQSAKKAFPGAEVYVAATNDMSERPFPFALKEKLAKLAGVDAGHFVQVKNPFQSKEITQNYNPDEDVLVFVRSEKDRNEQPKPGGTKKDGSPAYFQPYTGEDLQPFSKHAYMAYLPTVEFGPGITSATQIRKAWPTLNDKRKLAMVMSLYPAAQKNPKLAQTVVGMFDQVMGGQLDEGLGDYITKKIDDFLDTPKVSSQEIARLMKQAPSNLPDDVAEKLVAKFMETEKAKRLAQQAADANKTTVEKIVPYLTYFGRVFVDRWKQIPQRDRDNVLKNLVHNIGRFLLFILEVLAKGLMKKESVAEELDEAVGDNYLYHATQPGGIMRILRSGAIKASYRPQEATKARTQSPTVSTTRSKQYAESDDFVNFLNLTKEGNSVIIVFDRNAVANHYKMFSTSQGTQTVGDEFEEVIVVPKGAMPIQGTMKGFYFNPRRTKELEAFKEIPWFKELFNSPYYMGPKQGVAEGAPIVVAQAPIDVRNPKKAQPVQRYMGDIVPPTKPPSTEKRGVKGRPGQRPMPTNEGKVSESTDYLDEK